MEISLEELLSCEFFHKSRILAGEKGLDKVVSRVTTLDSPDAYQYFRGGEFVITTGYFFINDVDYQRELIKKLSERGVAGIGITLRYFNNELPPVIKKEADHFKLPLISLPNEAYYSDIYEFITSNLVSKTTKEIKRLNDVYKEIGDSVYNEGFLGISRSLYRWTGLKSVIEINDKIYPFPDNTLPDEFPMNEMLWKKKIFQNSTRSNIECFSWGKDNNCFEWIRSVIYYNNNRIGRIILFKNTQFEYITKDTCQLLDYSTSVCLIEVKRIKTIADFQRKYKMEFLRKLVFEGLDIEEIKKHAAIMDYYLPVKGLILLIQGLEEKYLDKIVCKIFSEHTLCGMLKDDLAIVYVDCTKKYEDKICSLYDELKSVSCSKNIAIGVGNVVSLDKISRSCDDAKSALEIGSYLQSDPSIYYFYKLGIYQLLKISNMKDEVKGFYEKHLKPLECQGEDNYLNYIKTLECYINNAYNFTETAEELHVHANTVRYRINIVEKLCNISFKNADDRLNVEVTMKMLPFLNKSILHSSES